MFFFITYMDIINKKLIFICIYNFGEEDFNTINTYLCNFIKLNFQNRMSV
jgi:hypothetical protein